MIEFVEGDMFEMPADIRVNTVNCVGVMGAGVALAFKKRYPEMYKTYQRQCRDGEIRPGRLQEWRSLEGDWVVNFPTKRDWKEPSRYEDIETGLDALREYLSKLGPRTVALPALGCGHGGLDWARVSALIKSKLGGLEAHLKVFEPSASRRMSHEPQLELSHAEREELEALGLSWVTTAGATSAGLPTPLAMGPVPAPADPWIAVLPSREPAERETQALESVARQLALQRDQPTVALVHYSRKSEALALSFAGMGLRTVLLLPFGILSRKAIARLPEQAPPGLLSLVSLAPPSERWSRAHLAAAVAALREASENVLVSDPHPEWLDGRSGERWAVKRMAYIRYMDMPPETRRRFDKAKALPIGRRPENGVPNLSTLLGDREGTIAAGSLPIKAFSAFEKTTHLDIEIDDLALDLQQAQAIVDLLANHGVKQLSLRATFADAERRQAFDEALAHMRTNNASKASSRNL